MVLRSLPLAEQVRTQILQWIQSGTLSQKDGALPSETEIAEMLNTSRATVREALAQLERDRFVIRKQGSGTYINPTVRHLTSTIADLLDPESFISLQGFEVSVPHFTCSDMNLKEPESQALSTLTGSAAFRVSILYHAGPHPAIWLEAIIPTDPLLTDQLAPRQYIPLSRLVHRITGTYTSHSIATIDAVNADSRLSELLCVDAGYALMHLQEIHLSDFGRPVFMSHQYFIPGIFNLQLLRNSYRLSERFSVW